MNPLIPHLYVQEGSFATSIGTIPLRTTNLGGQIYYRLTGAWVKIETAIRDAGVFKTSEWYSRVSGSFVKSID